MMSDPTRVLAHISESGLQQPLRDHLQAVGALAQTFAKRITGKDELGDLGYLLGALHDVGKYQEGFQKYLRGDNGSVPTPHSPVGAAYVYRSWAEKSAPIGKVLSLCVASHHRGLYDDNSWWYAITSRSARAAMKKLREGMEGDRSELRRLLDQVPPREVARLSDCLKSHEEDLPLLIRMLFSCLVDADFLDTESFLSPERAISRRRPALSLKQMKVQLDAHLCGYKGDSDISRARTDFQRLCREHGQSADPGVYSLCLPTGGGKTLASMLWALERALALGRDRIIYVIPYTSIITQTAQTFREIFGAENVLEHHSDIDTREREDETLERDKLLTENWDAPLIVTTNVQFFESLFAHRVGRCRKLHNICNSVVVFDEVQMFPPKLLSPMLRVLEGLRRTCSVELLFCTATLPLFDQDLRNKKKFNQRFYSFKDQIQEAVPYDEERFASFDKVVYHLDPLKLSSADLAQRLSKHRSFLCIVNSRKDALRVYFALRREQGNNEGLIHLSRRMCSTHIQDKIDEIKRRLSDGDPVRVVSTQLVEAGVDLDFPVVYRASAGLDSIVQAAGRCNREGRMKEPGEVFVFSLTDGSKSRGEIAWAQYAMRDVRYKMGERRSPRREDMKRYYRFFYDRVGSFDKSKISSLLWGNENDPRCEELRFDYEEASKLFRYIDDETIPIVVPYGSEGERLVKKIRENGSLSREDYRLMHRLSVGVSEREYRSLKSVLTEGDIHCLQSADMYDEATGLKWRTLDS